MIMIIINMPGAPLSVSRVFVSLRRWKEDPEVFRCCWYPCRMLFHALSVASRITMLRYTIRHILKKACLRQVGLDKQLLVTLPPHGLSKAPGVVFLLLLLSF